MSRSEPDQADAEPVLVAVTDIPYRPEYHRSGIVGAVDTLLLHPAAYTRLLAAAERLAAHDTARTEFGLLVLDGYRPPTVQQFLYEQHVAQLAAARSGEQVEELATTYVSNPAGVYPHGTGGAVDLTLTVNGRPAWMGTGFDDFVERSRRDWYDAHPPRTQQDRAARQNRAVLFEAMAAADFVGLDSEWWHFEWGTERWARAVDQPTRLARLL
jgi:D-alanyl-D-alanine dipeptidase